MRRLLAAALFLTAAVPVAASEGGRLDPHEHGVGALRIASEGGRISMAFEAPGADIVGFEHAAESAEDRAAVDAAIAALAKPTELFVVPASAGCSVVEARAALVGEEAHDDHHDESTAHDDDEAHESDHAEHAEGEADHTEFEAEYLLACADPSALDRIDFSYFERFPNAREVEVQLVSAAGARAFEVSRDAPVLDLAGGM